MAAQTSQFSPFENKSRARQMARGRPGKPEWSALKIDDMLLYWLVSQSELDKAIFQVNVVVSFNDNIKTYISLQRKCYLNWCSAIFEKPCVWSSVTLQRAVQ